MTGMTEVLGATCTPHCAAVDPAQLVRGLADAVERLGGSIYEGSEVGAVHPGGRRRQGADHRRLGPGRGRSQRPGGLDAVRSRAAQTLLPVGSLVIATAPLPDGFWSGAGLAHRETFSDHRRLIIYGQRTADGRMAFGGRGAPYHFASAVRHSYDRAPRGHRSLRRRAG